MLPAKTAVKLDKNLFITSNFTPILAEKTAGNIAAKVFAVNLTNVFFFQLDIQLKIFIRVSL